MQDEPYSFGIYNWRGQLLSEALIDAEDRDRVMALEWTVDRLGYIRRRGKPPHLARFLHRFVLDAHAFDGIHVVDHINRVKWDCRKSNLRLVTHAQNRQNHPVKRGDSATSQYRGVFWNKRKQMWTATGACRHLAHFDDEEAAAACSREWRRIHLPYAET